MDTIFALSTPFGKSGVAVVRVSGARAKETVRALGADLPPPRRAVLKELTRDGVPLDHALVLYFPAPASFTGEDIVEYHIHGSRAVIEALLQYFSTLPGLRPAEPGEFTRRAFLSGRMDLTAAEGLADLLDAETEAQRAQAMRFLRGEAAAFYARLRSSVLEMLALTEAYIDFPEEDIPAEVLTESRSQAAALKAEMETQLAGAEAAERVRDGVQVAIIGPPNAGKSSLMNLLAKREIAIVSETAGTTRDVIEVHLDIAGFAVTVADTAGIREAEDAVEREGVRRSFARARQAHIRILVLDAEGFEAEGAWADLIDEKTLLVLNKTDLALPSPLPVVRGVTALAFSAHARTGMEALLERLKAEVVAMSAVESSCVARSRHRHHLARALEHLKRYAQAGEKGLELQCEELRRAAVEIGRITGIIAPDEVLGHIFSRFCIGK